MKSQIYIDGARKLVPDRYVECIFVFDLEQEIK